MDSIQAERNRLLGHLVKLREIANEQAADDGINFEPLTAPEAYLQQELRRLHRAIWAVTK